MCASQEVVSVTSRFFISKIFFECFEDNVSYLVDDPSRACDESWSSVHSNAKKCNRCVSTRVQRWEISH